MNLRAVMWGAVGLTLVSGVAEAKGGRSCVLFGEIRTCPLVSRAPSQKFEVHYPAPGDCLTLEANGFTGKGDLLALVGKLKFQANGAELKLHATADSPMQEGKVQIETSDQYYYMEVVTVGTRNGQPLADLIDRTLDSKGMPGYLDQNIVTLVREKCE